MNRFATSAETKITTSIVQTCQSNGNTIISTAFSDLPLGTTTRPTAGVFSKNMRKCSSIVARATLLSMKMSAPVGPSSVFRYSRAFPFKYLAVTRTHLCFG
uniref:(northern house mosquito) hypothetical protein n=1 Tax=Culex pipiens TaxID=7175 RepID=A0A8D8CTF8_CULPI